MHQKTPLLILIFAGALAAGCSDTPPRVAAPQFGPSKMASALMASYDQDRDGQLTGDELQAAAAIHSAQEFYDLDQDGRISPAEIEARLQLWLDRKVGLQPFFCRVTLNGRPLAGAVVTLQPEPGWESVLLPARGTTDASGKADIAIADKLLPEEDRGLAAMRPGLYRVEITHPEKNIAAKFNRQTVLGQEVAGDSLVGKDVVYDVSVE